MQNWPSPVYSAATAIMLGSTISHYRITGKLGTGGMGVVYEAEDTRLPRKVALKFLPDELADDPDAVRRFRREAETIATLSHAHICTIYDIDEHEGRVFIAMECVDGINLKTYMARHTLTTAQGRVWVRVESRKTEDAKAFEAAREAIGQELLQRSLDDWFDARKKTLKIEVLRSDLREPTAPGFKGLAGG